MKINGELRSRLAAAVEKAGGAKNFSKSCGINAANISRYLRGLVRTITDDNWEKLAPFLEMPASKEVPVKSGTVSGAQELRFVPVIEWSDANERLSDMVSDVPARCTWNDAAGESVAVPAESSADIRAFRVCGVFMEPKISDNDILLVTPVHDVGEIPDNKIVIAKFFNRISGHDEVVCKRFHHQNGGGILLTSDNPDGVILTPDPADIRWIGVAIRKISDL